MRLINFDEDARESLQPIEGFACLIAQSLMKVEILKLNPGDGLSFRELLSLFAEVFDMKDFQSPPVEHLDRLLDNSSFFVFVAAVSDEIVGGLTHVTYSLKNYR